MTTSKPDLNHSGENEIRPLDTPKVLPEDEAEFVCTFVAKVTWRPSDLDGKRGQGRHAHEYIVKLHLPDALKPEFDRFHRLFRTYGYKAMFLNYDQPWTYLDVDDNRYWVTRSYFEDHGPVINRCPRSEQRDGC